MWEHIAQAVLASAIGEGTRRRAAGGSISAAVDIH